MVTRDDIIKAHNRFDDQVFKTPMVYSSELSKVSGASVYLKMEHLQNSGSFKLRGALNKINGLSPSDSRKTLVAASTGNHGAAFAHVTNMRGIKSVLFLPEKAIPAKVKALEPYSVDIRYFGEKSMEAEQRAAEFANEIDGVLVHPYNDPEIIAGQGTIGIEIEEQLSDVEVVMASIGGGGLISGLATYFSTNNAIEVIGSQPENAAEMYHSIKNGHIVEPSEDDTISDATAGGLEDNSITYQICRQHLSGIDLCTEEQIREAVAFIVRNHQTIIEPGAALSVATLMNTDKYRGKKVAIVLTGKKINIDLLTKILAEYGNPHL